MEPLKNFQEAYLKKKIKTIHWRFYQFRFFETFLEESLKKSGFIVLESIVKEFLSEFLVKSLEDFLEDVLKDFLETAIRNSSKILKIFYVLEYLEEFPWPIPGGGNTGEFPGDIFFWNFQCLNSWIFFVETDKRFWKQVNKLKIFWKIHGDISELNLKGFFAWNFLEIFKNYPWKILRRLEKVLKKSIEKFWNEFMEGFHKKTLRDISGEINPILGNNPKESQKKSY